MLLLSQISEGFFFSLIKKKKKKRLKKNPMFEIKAVGVHPTRNTLHLQPSLLALKTALFPFKKRQNW